VGDIIESPSPRVDTPNTGCYCNLLASDWDASADRPCRLHDLRWSQNERLQDFDTIHRECVQTQARRGVVSAKEVISAADDGETNLILSLEFHRSLDSFDSFAPNFARRLLVRFASIPSQAISVVSFSYSAAARCLSLQSHLNRGSGFSCCQLKCLRLRHISCSATVGRATNPLISTQEFS
jgi:hypothetical protein